MLARPSASESDAEEAGDELPWPAAFRPVDDTDMDASEDLFDDEGDRTGEIELRDLPPAAPEHADEDEFETKFETWMSGPTGVPRHFRRL